MSAILGPDLGEFKGLVRIYDHDASRARFATIRTDPADRRGRPGAERPGLVVFETRIVAGRVADSRDGPRLHDLVANSMHEAGSCSISSSTPSIGQQDR
jgi:hypothetical protein